MKADASIFVNVDVNGAPILLYNGSRKKCVTDIKAR